jgi:hypothetical protein
MVLLVLTAGCGGPSLIIWHEDSTNPQAEILVNQTPVAVLDYGEAIQVFLDVGYHDIDAHPPGSDTNPWTEGGESWLVYVHDDVNLTLLQVQPQ